MDSNVTQTRHGARPVVRVGVGVDDANEDVEQGRRQPLRVGLGVLSKHESGDRSNGLKPAAEIQTSL